MSRYFVPITIDELKAKIEEALEKTNNGYASYVNITPTVAKDLSKVHFDCENFDTTASGGGSWYKGIMGYHTLNNGLSIFGMSAGGDWEWPCYMLLYWNGKELRGYVPKEGNGWNYKAKWALGNCNWEDFESGYGGEHNYPDQKFAMELGLFDDLEEVKNLSKKEKKEWYMEIEPDDIAHKLVDTNKIIADIKERIIRK